MHEARRTRRWATTAVLRHFAGPDVGGMRALGRVHELTAEWDIETIRVHRGVFRYVLRGPREPRQQALWGAAAVLKGGAA